MIKKDSLKKILNRFSKKRIGAVGDFIADEYIYGATDRVSREAPVLILKYDHGDIFPGGCGNACNNLNALGCEVIPFGVIGDDDTGKILLKQFRSKGINTSNLLKDKKRTTARKTRILAGGHHTAKQQVIRIDRESRYFISDSIEAKLIGRIKKELPNLDALIISDYNLGVISERLIEYINSLAEKKETIITVDSRFRFNRFKNITALTPNEVEASRTTGIAIGDDDESLIKCGNALFDITNPDALLITRGRRGMSLFEKNGTITSIDVYGKDEISDVTGAGDTVISAFTLALASGATFREAMMISNYAGGIVVMKSGTATVTKAELLAAIKDVEATPKIKCLKKR
ncbi:MAG: hypothetical protein D6734_00585 [Candidatus Schekmanbacteria bacterium]|nr:MAG: hypothetical protein D6734_00585 [Candidatus Schekmanbacteria bacterium]